MELTDGLRKKTGAMITTILAVLILFGGCASATPSGSAVTPSLEITAPSSSSPSPSPVPDQLKALDSNAAFNVAAACGDIGLDTAGISNFSSEESWESGTKYSFTYSGTLIDLYLYTDGSVYSIDSGGIQVYLDGSSPLKISDYVGSAAPTPAEYPESGHIFYKNGKERIAPLEVVTQGEDAFFIKLVDAKDESIVITFFVRPGETADIDVPLGDYILKYATGKHWYNEDILFGPRSVCSAADEILPFTDENGQIYGYTIELYLQADGNLSSHDVDMEDF